MVLRNTKEIAIRLKAEGDDQVERKFDRVGRSGQRSMKTLASSVRRPTLELQALSQAGRGVTNTIAALTGAFAAYASVVGAAQGLGFVVQTAREFDKLDAQLETATGSIEGAKAAFEQLTKFAASTPFALEQSVEAFIRLKNLGLDPSEAALRSYGNTASAMGRDLMQFIEAVADATVGEFERLKEFGIKASSEGDKVTFTFRGQETQVRKTGAEIEKFLRSLGDGAFAGAMERQMSRLDGAFSNFNDTVNATARSIAAGGFGDAVEEQVRRATSALSASQTEAEELGAALGDALRTTAAAAVVFVRHVDDIALALGGLVAARVGGRAVTALGVALQANVVAARNAAITHRAYGASLVQATGAAVTATAATRGLTLATTGLRTAVLGLGGPAGAVILAAGALWTFRDAFDDTSAAAERHRRAIEKVRDITREAMTASEDRRVELEKERKQLLANARAEVNRGEAAVRAAREDVAAQLSRLDDLESRKASGRVVGFGAAAAESAIGANVIRSREALDAALRDLDRRQDQLRSLQEEITAELLTQEFDTPDQTVKKTTTPGADTGGRSEKDKAADVVKALEDRRAALDRTAIQQKVYADLVKAGLDDDVAFVGRSGEVVGAVDSRAEAISTLNRAIAETEARAASAAKIDETIRALEAEATALEHTGRARAVHNALVRAGIRDAVDMVSADGQVIGSTNARAEAVAAAARRLEDVREQSKELARDIQTPMEAASEAAKRGIRGIEDAFVELATTGKLSFSDMATSIISDMIRIAAQQAITGPLLQAFGGSGGAGGGGGFLQTAFSFLGSFFHEGGAIGGPAPGARPVPVAAFAAAPRMHTGGRVGSRGMGPGLRPGERSIIAKLDEVMFTPRQLDTSAALVGQLARIADRPVGGMGKVEIRLYDSEGRERPANARRQSDGRGGERIDIQLLRFVERTVNDGISRGAFDRRLSDAFGLSRQGRAAA